MIEEDSFVELTKTCSRACRTLMATGGGAESSSGPSKRQIEDLGRCVDPI